MRPRLLQLVRPFTLLAPVVGTLSGAGIAAATLDQAWDALALGYACLSAAAATGASNAWNQVFDAEIDRANKPTRPIPAGAISRRGALAVGDLLGLAALILGALASTWFLACVAIGLLGSWIYSAPPLRTRRQPFLALLTIAIPRGVLVPVAGWSVVAEPTASDPWALGAIAGLYVFGASATKDFSDVAGDREHGCRTLPVLWGAVRAARWIAPFLVLPFLLYPVFGWLGWLQVSIPRLAVLGGSLALLGGLAVQTLLRDPNGLARGNRAHPAWIWMYVTLLASQVGAVLVYAL